MSKTVEINKQKYVVNQNDYNIVPHQEFNNLKILDSLGIHERLISLLKELSFLGINNLKVANVSHGGYIPIQLASTFKKILVSNSNENKNLLHVLKNSETYDLENIFLYDSEFQNEDYILFINDTIEPYNYKIFIIAIIVAVITISLSVSTDILYKPSLNS